MNKLAKAEQGLAKRLDPAIQTTAEPAADWLLQARAEVNSNPAIRVLFTRARSEGLGVEWLVDQLATALVETWRKHTAEAIDDQATEAAQYLADEFFQLGSEGIHIVSADTGRIVTTITEDDIYQPAPLPREGGGMATPLPRLDPALEGFITTWTFEKSREQRIIAKLIERGYKAMDLTGPDDPRLATVTRSGRRRIMADIAEMTPESLLRGLGGTSAAFLGFVRVQTHPPDDPALEGPLEGSVTARSVLKIPDPVTTNLRHDRKATLRGVLPQGWVREIVRRMSELAAAKGARKVHASELQPSDLEGAAFWAAPPELVAPILKLRTELTILPADRAYVMGLRKGAGVLVVPESFGAESHELFERWEAVANLDYQLWVDWSKVTCLDIEGVEYQAHVV